MDRSNYSKAHQEVRINRDQLVTLDDLQEFKDDLLLSIKGIIQCQAPQPLKRWLKSYEVKKLLNISTGTLQNLRSNGTLPHTKIGGLIYYDAELINKVMAGQRGETDQSARPILKRR